MKNFFVSETGTKINIDYGVTSESNFFSLPIDDAVRVGGIIEALLSHFNFQKAF